MFLFLKKHIFTSNISKYIFNKILGFIDLVGTILAIE
uniref:Uncharacterized protein n=1 Tax=Anguilla anguilla TaxID=7936 RepID=A0A0E9Q591_ANGAN